MSRGSGRLRRLPGRRPRRPSPPRVDPLNHAQVVVSVVVAVSLAMCVYCTDRAAGAYADADRAVQVRGDLMVEAVRSLYVDEAPTAYSVGVLETRAGLEAPPGASLSAQQAVRAESEAANVTAFELRSRYAETGGLLSAAYGEPGSVDMAARLADLLDPDDTSDEISAAISSGERWATAARAISWVPVVALLLYLFVAVAMWSKARRGRRSSPSAADDVGLVQVPLSDQRGGRAIVGILTVAWLLVTIVPVIQTDRSLDAERAASTATRLRTDLGDTVIASQVLAGFRATTSQSEIMSSMRVTARRYAATFPIGSEAAEQRALASAERQAQRAVEDLGASMTEAPASSDVGTHAAEAISSTPDDWSELLGRHQAATDQGADLTQQGRLAGLAVLLAVLATSVASLARVGPEPAAGLRGVAGGLVAGGLVCTALAFLA